jgi:hypothetical protein
MVIGKNNAEAVNWIQERLGYIPRHFAESCLRRFKSNGIVRMEDRGYVLTESMSAEEMNSEAKIANAEEENTKINTTKMMRRRSISTMRQKHSMTKLNNKMNVVTLHDETQDEQPPPEDDVS